jgi:PAS domain S-box-containing protein
MPESDGEKKHIFEDLVALHQSIVSGSPAPIPAPARKAKDERESGEPDEEPIDNRFELLCDFFPMGIMLAEITRDRYRRPEGYKPVNVNKEYARLLGLARVTVLEREFFDVLPGGLAEWAEALEEVVTKGRKSSGVSYWDATDTNLLVTLFLPRRDLLAVVVEDVALRAATAGSVDRHEKQLDSVLRMSPDLVCRFLPDGTLTYANRAYCEFFKKVREELVGHCFVEDIPDDEVEFVRSKLSTLTRVTPTVTYQHRLEMETGTRWVEWTDIAIFDGDGVLTEYQSHGRDVTVSRSEANETARIAGYMDDLLLYHLQAHSATASEATETKQSAEVLSGEVGSLREEVERLRGKTISGRLAVCSSCSRIHDDEGHWMVVPLYLESHTAAHVGSEVCPYCRTKAERELERKRRK